MTVRWTEEIIIQSDDVDFRSECRWSAMLGFMQRAADTHIEKLGVSRDQMLEQGLGWMLITMDMEMANIPQYADEIHISTWSRGAKGALWNRDYRFTDRTGKEFGSARSVWALVDIHKRRILRPSAFPYEVPVHMESAGSPPDKAIIPEGTALKETYAHTVRYSGIDSNGHLNNARYADLCFDVLEENELTKGRAAGFKITYHREARMGDEIRLRRSSGEGDTVYVQGVSSEGTNFF
ncbi:acyl-[acyl-carrier-protein] thioesterase [Paenibacillus sp. DMB20]|uniref:acyl-[acyl-carrier-protein] thioesterase n=1 Tax=Paenibacillus sp. DMB20 TaxID=1642570 RepID=UPI000627B61A|nr:acyl-ACP thioesterase domain-containing protein [Paenibacillus sp. DMB20]KKO51456.1 acyl-ACP thioesterase [Paenibacillus sp. DMB20]